MTSSNLRTSVVVRPHENDDLAFWKISTLRIVLLKKTPVFVMPKKGFLHVHRRIKQGLKTSRPVVQDK